MKIAVIIGLLLVVAAILVLARLALKRQEINSFWDVVRNPDAMPDLDQFHKEVDDAAESLTGSPEEIAKLVDYYVFDVKSSQDGWTELRILDKLGSEAYPRALDILGDPSERDKLTALSERENLLPEAPINRLCQIFEQDTPPPPEAAALLSPFLESQSKEIRKSVALTLGAIASIHSLPDLRKALADKDRDVCGYTLMGILRAIEGGRIEPSSKDDFFALVANTWPGDMTTSHSELPLILLRLDRERAVEYLLDEDLFTIRFHSLWTILQAFSRESVEVPRSRILAIIADAEKEPPAFPLKYVLEEGLALLAAHRHDEDLALFERFLEHENEDICRGAVRAIYRFHRFHDRIRNPWEIVEDSGWSALTLPEKHICALMVLTAEVNNGGFAQYYFNSSGDHWQDARDGLAAIGAEKRLGILLATVDKFGVAKPASDRDVRTSQLSKLVPKSEDPFSNQDIAWYKAKDENLDRLMLKYNLAHQTGRQKAPQ